MHDDQLRIDADAIREMIFEQFPQYRHERIEQLGDIGTANAVFRIGSGASARFPLRAADATECAEQLRAEAASMAEFARHSPFSTPQPIGTGHSGPHYPLP